MVTTDCRCAVSLAETLRHGYEPGVGERGRQTGRAPRGVSVRSRSVDSPV